MDSKGLKHTGIALMHMIEVLLAMGLVFSAGRLLQHGWSIAEPHWQVYAGLVAIPLVVGLFMVYIIRSQERPVMMVLILTLLSAALMLVWLYLGFPLLEDMGEIGLWVAAAVGCGLLSTYLLNRALGRKGEWLRNLVPG